MVLRSPRVLTVTVGGSGPATGHVDVQRFDIAWNAAVHGTGQPHEVLLDLGTVGYLDQESLLYLVGLLAYRQANGLKTLLRLPTSDATIDYLRAWNFPKAVRLATHAEFLDFLEPDSRKLYQATENQPSRYVEVVATDRGGRETLLPVSFFAATPVALEDPQEAATVVRDEWLNGHVVGVLERHLGHYADRIATCVLHEAVLNAATHPKASVALTSSQLLARPRPTAQPALPGEKELVISIWDNGLSIDHTLAAALKVHGTIASPAYGLVSEKFHVSVTDRRSRPQRPSPPITLTSTTDTSALGRRSLLLASAFFLGITSTPSVVLPNASAAAPEEVPEAARRYTGLGLHAIRRTVCDLFSGSLLYASGNTRLTLVAGDARGEYIVNITRRNRSDAFVGGNLLVARMRLRPTP